MSEPRIKRPRVGWRDPLDAYLVDWSNNRVCFAEYPGGPLVSAVITPGLYSDLELAGMVKAAMDAAASTHSYAVWRDGDTDFFWVQQLNCASGFDLLTPCASSIFYLLGFTTLPRSGSCSYRADVQTPDMMYFDFLEPVRDPAFTFDRAQRSDLRAYSGKRRSYDPRQLLKRWEAEVRFPSFSHLDGFMDFLAYALTGGSFRWWQHQGAWGAHRWIKCQLGNTADALKERLPLFKNFTYRVKLEECGDNDGPIELEDLQDR